MLTREQKREVHHRRLRRAIFGDDELAPREATRPALVTIEEWVGSKDTVQLAQRRFLPLVRRRAREALARLALIGEEVRSDEPADPVRLALINLMTGTWPQLQAHVSTYTVADVIAAETKAMRAALVRARRWMAEEKRIIKRHKERKRKTR